LTPDSLTLATSKAAQHWIILFELDKINRPKWRPLSKHFSAVRPRIG
jgi:hypothetical protein